MLRSGDVVWEPDREAANKLTAENSERKSRNRRHTAKQKSFQNGSANFDPSEIGEKSNNSSCTTNNGVTLKDLNREDKQKIAQLVIELAKVGEEKENVVHALNDERQQFLTHVRQFEDEKNMLMSKQHFLAEEVKQCQTLLQYYQNLITTQQTSILAHEKSQRLSPHVDMMSEKHQKSSLSRCLDAGAINTDELSSQTGGIEVNDISSSSSGMNSAGTTNSSIMDDEVLRMSDRQYNIYLQKKKEKLKKEQKNLRKLLTSKVQPDSELEDIKISPVHPNRSEQSQSLKPSIEMRSVPVQTMSPVWDNKASSYLSPSRTASNKTHHRSYTSSQSSETLKRSASPANILHILSQTIANEGMQEVSSASMPLSERISNLSLSSSDAGNGIATNIMNCDDSQILEDIFFV